MSDFDDDYISKTQRKADAQKLQELGLTLLQLPDNLLASIALPDAIAAIISETKQITSQNALRRQHQRIGKLMRSLDDDTINTLQQYINNYQRGNALNKQKHLGLEKLREQLLHDDGSAMQRVLQPLNTENKQILTTLVAQAKEEAKQQRNGKSYKKLFVFLRENVT